MTTFSVGDKVRVARPNYSQKWRGHEGVVVTPKRGDYPLVRVYFENPPPGELNEVTWSVSKLDLIAPATTDQDIYDALARVKEAHDLCEEFDGAVREAEDMPLLRRLKIVAKDRNRKDLYAALEAELKPRPEEKLPEVGKWIRAVMGDGETREGEVTHVGIVESWRTLGAYKHVDIVGYGNSHIHVEGSTCGHSDKYSNIVSWDYIDAPRKVKWPKGSTVQSKQYPNIVRITEEDVYEGDYYFNDTQSSVSAFQRVEITVVG